MKSATLEVQQLTLSYKNHMGGTCAALRDVTLQLVRGATLGIAGESGSGKTTLILAILRHFRPGCELLRGCVKLDGH